jgi:branched-chain amino acid transport system substrate-binding protein
MSKNRVRFRGSVAVVTAVFGASVLAACGSSSSSSSPAASSSSTASSPSSTGATAPSKSLSGTFTVAVMAPFTGGDASEGAAVQGGATLALQTINGSGGVGGKRLVLKYLDTKGDPTSAATVAAEIVGLYQSGKVQAAIGPSDSDEALAAVPVLQRAGVPDIGTTPSSPEITTEKFTDFVRLVQSDVSQATQLIDFAAYNLHKKRLAIIYENNDYGQGVEQYELSAAKTDGVSIVSVQTYTPNQDTDFSTQITAMAKADPDTVILDTSYNEGGEILRQAHGLGLTNVSWVASGDNLYQDYITLASGQADGTYILTVFNSFGTAAKTVAFVKPFETKYNTVPAEGAWTAYDALFMIQQQFNAGATSKTLIAKIKATTFDGAGGSYAFDQYGDVDAKPLSVVTVQDNKFVPSSLVVAVHG